MKAQLHYHYSMTAYSAGDGGALYVSAVTSTTLLNISSSTFISNAATLTDFGGGGAVLADGGVFYSFNNTFAYNAASGYGGALAYGHQCFNVTQLPGEILLWQNNAMMML